MPTGTLLAIIVGILIVLAILWFMTRAGRNRPSGNVTSSDLERQGRGTGPTGPDSGIVTESVGVASATDRTPPARPAHEHPDGGPPRSGADTCSGVHGESSATGEAGGSPSRGAVGGLAAGAAAVAGAEAAAPATNANPSGAADADSRPTFDPDNNGHPLPGERGTMRGPDVHALPSAQAALTGDYTVDSGNSLHDVREMLKILNLRESEAPRLDLSPETFQALWRGEAGGLDDGRLRDVAERLRRMIR